MLGLRNISALERQEDTPQHAWVSGCYRDGDGALWRELAMSELLYDNNFLQAGV
jgi:hypothetical protein